MNGAKRIWNKWYKFTEKIYFMKKIFVILCAFLPIFVYAKHVNPEMALQVADNILNAPIENVNGVVKAPLVRKHVQKVATPILNNQMFYVFNAEEGGFAIVSADDIVIPILGYSVDGYLDLNNIPAALNELLKSYNSQIEYAIQSHLNSNKSTEEAWKKYSQGNVKASPIIGPLVTSNWDQAPYYNDKCPYNIFATNSNYHTVTGCAATALAQVMRYWQWPTIGEGSHTDYTPKSYAPQTAYFGLTEYDWRNMPNQLTDNSSSAQKDAVSTLMYHCGVAMDMDFGIAQIIYIPETNIPLNKGRGSGIDKIEQVENAVKSYFRYSSETKSIHKKDYATDAAWLKEIKAQLDASIPMVYVGKGPGGGHAFVCDGYDSQNYFHFNWGWSGLGNGFYPITELVPGINGYGSGSGGGYSLEQSALVNMKPRTTANAYNLQLYSKWTLNSSSIRYGGTLNAQVSIRNCGTQNFVGDISALILDEDGNFFAKYVIQTGCTLKTNTTYNVTTTVSQNAGLVPGDYYVYLCYENANTGIQLVGSEYYANMTYFNVYWYSDIEANSEIIISSDYENALISGKDAVISVKLKNEGSTYFDGKVATVIAKPDLSGGQTFDEIDMSITGISAGSTKNINFRGKVDVDPGDYVLVLMYRTKSGQDNFVGSKYYKTPILVHVYDSKDIEPSFELTPGRYAIVATRATDADKKWYYLSATTAVSKTRLDAVSTGTDNINSINLKNLSSDYVWDLVADGSNWKLKNGSQYITWESGNTAKLGIPGKSLTFEIAENQVQAHFYDGTAERYLSLNRGYDYFAFYANTGQITHLYFLPIEDQPTPPTPAVNEYYIVAKRSTGNYYFFTPDKVSGKDRLIAVDAGTSIRSKVDTVNTSSAYLWTLEDSGSGKLLKNHNGSYLTCTEAKTAAMASTGKVLKVTNNTDGTTTFSYAADASTTHYLSLANAGSDYFVFYANTNQVTHLLLMPKGSGAATNIEDVLESPKPKKFMRDGQILIERCDGFYNMMGQKVR